MPTLRNARHEKFALGLSEGKSASQAYIDAGYKPCRQNAARLTTKDDIKQRLAELQDATARSTAITVESICRELDAANAVAKERGQASAMVSASALRAKLAGLLVEKVEVSNTHSFDQCETMADLADEILAQLIEGFRPVDEKDREGLIVLFERHMAELADYTAAIKARPALAERVDQLPTHWQTLQPRTAPRRISNGSRR